MSKEHIVTGGIWTGNEIGVRGMSWCPDHKFISVDSFSSNILCTTHNNNLSPVDQAGIDAFTVFRNAWKYHDERMNLAESGQWSGPFDLIEQRIDGPGLERWLLKTLINMEVVGDQKLPIGPFAKDTTRPPKELVDIAFGKAPFSDGAGLYFPARVGLSVNPGERIMYRAFIKDGLDGSYVAAGAFLFYGFTFLLYLGPGGLSDHIQQIDSTGRVVEELGLMHRLNGINMEVGGRSSQTISFKW